MNTSSEDAKLLSIMVRGAYDLQMLRMQSGIRLVANFRAKLFNEPSDTSKPNEQSESEVISNPKGKNGPSKLSKPQAVSEPRKTSTPQVPSDGEDTDEEAEKMIDMLRASYRNLMAGVARNRTLPAEKGFKGDHLISSFAELVLVDSYMALEKQETRQFDQLESQLNKFKIWTHYLVKGSRCMGGREIQSGIGPAMGGVLISWLDPYKARNISSFWKYCGLDVADDGRGRSRRKEHLVEREYIDKNGRLNTRMSITYDPFLKTKLMGVLAGSFIRSGSPWRQVYDGYKHRLLSDESRIKIELKEWKKRNDRGDDMTNLWAPGRIDTAAKRYMIKQFLAELWVTWREMEGLPITQPYAVDKLGYRPHAA